GIPRRLPLDGRELSGPSGGAGEGGPAALAGGGSSGRCQGGARREIERVGAGGSPLLAKAVRRRVGRCGYLGIPARRAGRGRVGESDTGQRPEPAEARRTEGKAGTPAQRGPLTSRRTRRGRPHSGDPGRSSA